LSGTGNWLSAAGKNLVVAGKELAVAGKELAVAGKCLSVSAPELEAWMEPTGERWKYHSELLTNCTFNYPNKIVLPLQHFPLHSISHSLTFLLMFLLVQSVV